MKTMDPIAQRIFATFMGASLLIATLCVLLFSLNTIPSAKANNPDPATAQLPKNAPWDDGVRGAVGLGMHEGKGYFVIWANPNRLYKVDLDRAIDWFSE